jgi:hypothetical protein
MANSEKGKEGAPLPIRYSLLAIRPRLFPACCSHAAGPTVRPRQLGTQEDDAVPGRIAGVPFHLGIGHGNSRPLRDRALAVGHDGDAVVAVGLEHIGLERIGLPAAADGRIVGLHQGLESLADRGGRIGPLAPLARQRDNREVFKHPRDNLDIEWPAF